MAIDSRNVRKKRRVRRNLSLATRQIKTLQGAYLRTHSTLLMVLEAMGQVTVPLATMKHVLDVLPTLSWQSQPVEGGFVLSLVRPAEGETVGTSQTEDKALTIRTVAEDEDPLADAPGSPLVEQASGDEVV